MSPRELFDAAYLRVCNGLNVDPVAEQADECWLAAQFYPASLYQPAASRLNATIRFLPKPAEWREALRDLAAEADQEQRRAREAVLAATDQRTYHCAVCQDTGWEMRTHPAGQCPICPKRHLYEAEWATECLCRPTNPTWQHKVDRQREMVHTPTRERRTA